MSTRSPSARPAGASTSRAAAPTPIGGTTAIGAGNRVSPSGMQRGTTARGEQTRTRQTRWRKRMAKRGNNEGSIYKRKDGRWAAAVTVDGGRRKTVYGATRAGVQQKLVRL